jgi:cell division septation protein DedD
LLFLTLPTAELTRLRIKSHNRLLPSNTWLASRSPQPVSVSHREDVPRIPGIGAPLDIGSSPDHLKPPGGKQFRNTSASGFSPTFSKSIIDTAGPLGRAFVVIIGAIAELERNLIVERVRAGMRRAKLDCTNIDRNPLTLDH